jgi:hypothetical protein
MNPTLGARQLANPFVNIVPLQGQQIAGQTVVPIGLAPAAGIAQLIYRGGPLITQIVGYGIYWGSAWSAPAPGGSGGQAVTRQALDGYLNDLLASAYIDLLAEYSVQGMTISRGMYLGSSVIGPDPGPQVSDADIQAQIQQRMADGTIPGWDANTLYVVFLPSGTTVQQGGAASCQVFCGYHDAVLDPTTNAPLAYYAVLPYPDCGGCAQAVDGTPLAPFDALTTVASHEVAEAITDPVPGTGWYDDQNGEIGDICAWQLATVDGYTVQQEWSNAASTCVGPASS